MLKAFVTIFWVYWVSLAQAQTHPEPVDRAVALVDNAVVTASDLSVHVSLGAIDKSFVPILNGNPDTVLEDAIQATVIQAMAGRISVYQPNPAQVRSRVEAYRSHWASKDSWRQHLLVLGLNEKSILRAFEKRLVIERVVSRTLGTPEEATETNWEQQFQTWIAREREGVRVRLVPFTSQPARP